MNGRLVRGGWLIGLMSGEFWMVGLGDGGWVGLSSPHTKLQVYCYHCRLNEFITIYFL